VGRTNFYYLLVALLLFLFIIPVADQLGSPGAPIVRGLVFSSLFVIGIWSLRGGGRYFTLGMTFVVAGLVLNVLAVQTDSVFFQHASLLSMIGFLVIAISFTLRQVLFGTDISANRLLGAVCVYLLLGVIWALSYSMIELTMPGSFSGFEAWSDRGFDSEWIYFSFVTMTTLGYGDVLPISATARALAYLQAVFGQFYIAVLVAGLVSAYISNRQSDAKND
jgi:voltage-gated potassium channel